MHSYSVQQELHSGHYYIDYWSLLPMHSPVGNMLSQKEEDQIHEDLQCDINIKMKH